MSRSAKCEDMRHSVIFLLLLPHLSDFYAQPKGYTDDPYVDDEKFVEKGIKNKEIFSWDSTYFKA